MKYIKCVLFFTVLSTINQSHSRPTGVPDGWNCYHDGEIYAVIGDFQICPNPHGFLTDHDPNDHNCVIFKFRRYVQH